MAFFWRAFAVASAFCANAFVAKRTRPKQSRTATSFERSAFRWSTARFLHRFAQELFVKPPVQCLRRRVGCFRSNELNAPVQRAIRIGVVRHERLREAVALRDEPR